MKIFQYIYYFIRSLYYRGALNTIKLLTYEGKYEKLLGIKTHSIVNLSGLTLAGDSSEQNHHYQGASYYILISLFNKLPQTLKDYPFIDFGCGKGRAIFVAEQCGFTNLIGVDIAKELIDEAITNLSIYKLKNLNSKLSFLFIDATKYQIPSNAMVFYFFNPFGPDIMQLVINNLNESVKLYPRVIYCLYLNPKYKSIFEKNGFTLLFEEKNKHYLEAVVYTLS